MSASSGTTPEVAVANWVNVRPSFERAKPTPVWFSREKAINHDPHFKDIRRQVTEYLLGVGGRQRTAVSRKLHLPDLEPEDLSIPRAMFGVRRRPIRRSEIKRETVEVE